MTLKLLQLNINSDNYWDKLIPYLTSHDFDILQLQEVTGDGTISGNIHSTRDVYEEFKKILSSKYKSEIAICQRYASSVHAYLASATFYKKDLLLQNTNVITLHKNTKPIPPDLHSYETVGRNVLDVTLSISGKLLSLLNAHLAWAKTPQEEPHQTKQAEILLKYIKSLSHPFILTGDFNLGPDQPTIQKFGQLARNLGEENKLVTTLNPRTHRAKELFPPGVVVDYIFTSNELTIKKFEVLEEDLSDHFGLIVEIEI